MPPNYYILLSVAYDDLPERIRAAYRLIVRRVHPDIAGADQACDFQHYTEAYRALINPEQRLLHNPALGIFARPLHFTRYDSCPRCWAAGCERCGGQSAIGTPVTLTVQVQRGIHDENLNSDWPSKAIDLP